MGFKVQKGPQYFLLILSGLLYIYLGYFVERHESVTLLLVFGILFIVYLYLFKNEYLDFKNSLIFSILFRVLFFFSVPILSDDIYRFIWDGRLIQAGIHPFAHVPSWFVNQGKLPDGLTISLFNKLNSPEYFTIYPPIGQFLFWLASLAKTTLGSAIVIRGFILLAEIGSIFLLKKLCRMYKVESNKVMLYALNPLVIIELTGNLHLEAFMIFFTLLALYLYKRGKLIGSGVSISFAIAAKLVPLIFLPVFLRRLPFKRLLMFSAVIACSLILLFLPLYSNALVDGMTASVSLYFKKFEFNASIYYLVREVGFWIKGYNVIGTAGPWLSVISLTGIMAIALFSRTRNTRIASQWLWMLLCYFLFATIIHPWYVTTLVALSVLTTHRFPIIWSGLIFLSYIGYSETEFNENMLVVGIEYGVVVAFIIYELYVEFSKKSISETTEAN